MPAMTRTILAALLLAASVPAIAQQQAPPPPVLVDPKIAALRDDALANDQYGWDIVEGLTTEVGQRLAGTEAEARARDWAVKKLTAMGFSNVRIEPFDLPVWTRGYESAEITAPFPQKLAVTALGNSASTGMQGISGQIVAFNSIDELRAAPDAAVAGKIVFVDHRMAPTQNGSSYGPGGAPRRMGPTIASLKGAIGIIVRSAGTDHHRNPHAGVQTFLNGAKPIPAGAISIPDAEQLARILKRGLPVSLHLTLVSQQSQGKSGNVIAEVPGRDPSLPAIVVGGHLDSWDLGTGAIDDGAGVAITTAAAKRIMDAGQPLRTIKVVWFGAEETGLWGAEAFRKAYGKDKFYALGESDFGADRVWQVNSKLGDDRKDEARMLAAALAPLGIVTGSFTDADASDLGPMIEDGHPGVGLSQDGTRYFDYHHTPDDTLDKIDPVQLRQNVSAWTTVLGILSGPIEAPKVKKKR